jgi:signal transduction histidine kinase/CheY-like chemotaxis protein
MSPPPTNSPDPLRLRGLLRYLKGREAGSAAPLATEPVVQHAARQGDEPDSAATVDELRLALAASEADSRAKSQFLAHLGHEIRTPMSGITGMAQLLAGTTLDVTQRGYVDLMQRSAGSLIALVDRLLDFSRLEAGPVDLRAEAVDLRSLLDEVVAEAWPRAAAKRLLFECQLAPNLPRWVRADPARLRQIVGNLLDNALEFTGVGQVVLSARGEPQGIVIEVADTGVGIAPELQASVFAPFVQGDASLARRQGGVGLGLAVVHLLVRAMGGRIELHSVPGRGASFRVHLKLSSLDPTLPGDTLLSATRRVAVVSDAPASQQALADRFHHLGHEVVSRITWRELAFAPEALAATQPQLVLYDEPPAGWPVNAPSAADSLPWTVLLLPRGTQVPLPLSAGEVLKLERPVNDGNLARAFGAPTRAAGPAAPPAAAGRARGRVLLVEDHEINQVVARSFLEHLGFEVHVASDAAGAFAALGARDYALLLMDCQLPGMDGYELTRRIRAGEAGAQAQRAPIVALTAHATPADRERCLQAGMNDYLAKPVNPQQLGSTLERWLAPTRG